jgi:PilZ domain
MQAASFPARRARTHYRHELRTLTYVTLDDANGGIIRNLSHEGVAVQALAALRPERHVRLRFELKSPRLRVETSGQVSWASASGQCGIRFVDLPARTRHQINEWIFSNLLDAIARDAGHPRSIFGASVVSITREENAGQQNAREENVLEENDGLRLSPAPRSAILLEPGVARQPEATVLHPSSRHAAVLQSPVLTSSVLNQHSEEDLADYFADSVRDPYAQLNWLSRPLSGRTLSWLVDGLVVTAALLMFALIFLSIAHELPPLPLTLGTVAAAAVFVALAYRAVFAVFGGRSLGARLARAVSSGEEKEESEDGVRIR